MSELFVEVLLRLAGVVAAVVLGGLAYLAALAAGGTPSPELALLSFLAGAALVLLFEHGSV